MWALRFSVSLSTASEIMEERPGVSLEPLERSFPLDLLSSQAWSGKEPNSSQGIVLYYFIALFFYSNFQMNIFLFLTQKMQKSVKQKINITSPHSFHGYSLLMFWVFPFEWYSLAL